ncbi:MAG TPA: ATP-binding protein [Vicinamibacterales bacterium]|nr:ATP-binding protein [Vicinamibacterales bacterium]
MTGPTSRAGESEGRSPSAEHAARRHRLLWLIAGRAAAITALLGSAILVEYRGLGVFPIDPFFGLLGLTYALTIVWILTLRFVDRHPWLIDVQLACDALIASAIVYLTGGVGSYFSTLYTLPIIAASMVQSWRGGLTVSVLSAAIYSALVIAQYQHVPLPLVVPPESLPAPRMAFYSVGLNVFGFLAVAALSGYLAEGLRRTGAQLAETSTQLADLQAFNQHVIDSLTSGLATCDVQGRLLTFNHAAEAITGVPATDAVGADVLAVLQLPPPFRALFDPGPRPVLKRREYGFTRPGGRPIELGITVAPLITPRGESGFLFTFLDVTELKRKDREARVQQRLAAVGEMAAGIAHEIRNPLASMAGSIQILRDELPLTSEQSQLMDIVLRESDRLNETIRNFLAFAKPQRSAATDFDVRRVVSDAARLLENSADVTAAHAIVVDVPPDPVILHADEAQIRQIVWNLATNGLRAMPSGGRLRLEVRRAASDAAEGDVIVAVRDDGVGIAPEDMDTIFQPFRGGFRGGTGLGLSIVHRIASDYGGEVRVASEKGKGTSVEVALPVGRQTTPEWAAPAREEV